MSDNYYIFYNFKAVGDVLMISFFEEEPDDFIINDDIAILKKAEKIIGINIFHFSRYGKIKACGMIALPPDILVDLINSIITTFGIKPLSYKKSSSFLIGKVLAIHDRYIDIDLNDNYIHHSFFKESVKVGDMVVVGFKNVRLFTNREFKTIIADEIKIDCHIVSKREIGLIGDDILILNEGKIGGDFFIKDEK